MVVTLVQAAGTRLRIGAAGLVVCLSLGLGMTFFLSDVHGRVGMPAPEISHSTWLNSEPQRLADLKGKVVLVFGPSAVTTVKMSSHM